MFQSKRIRSRTFRVAVIAIVAIFVGSGFMVYANFHSNKTDAAVIAGQSNPDSAVFALGKLAVKAAASHDGYSRDQFGSGWATVGSCDMREQILNRDLEHVKDKSADDCTVLSGTLDDPYSGETIQFIRGPGTSEVVQIDHIVAVSNAWQTGAQSLTPDEREQFYNDPLELIAVSGVQNNAKSDADASEWLPSNKSYECRYVARQIAVKLKYHLWITSAEREAIQSTLNACPGQLLPQVN